MAAHLMTISAKPRFIDGASIIVAVTHPFEAIAIVMAGVLGVDFPSHLGYTISKGGFALKIYTIIGGVNGVGKSSLTGVLRSEINDLGIIIDVDKITAACGGDKLTGGKIAITKINECLTNGVSFTQETTLSGTRTIRTVKQAIDLGYQIRLYYVGLDTFEESRERIANRVKKGGHNIPDEDVDRRFENRFDSLTVILPYCNEVSFFDNFNGFVEVAEYKNGELIIKGDYHPKWIIELGKYLSERA